MLSLNKIFKWNEGNILKVKRMNRTRRKIVSSSTNKDIKKEDKMLKNDKNRKTIYELVFKF